MASTYEPIATTTVSSDTASVSFSSISGSYTDLYIVTQARATYTTNDIFRMRVGNGSVDTGSNYSNTRLGGDGSSAFSDRASNVTNIDAGYFPGADSTSGVFGVSTFHLQNYSNTSTYKTILNRAVDAGAVYAYSIALVALWRSTSAINTVSFYFQNSNIKAGSTFTLYGIKAA